MGHLSVFVLCREKISIKKKLLKVLSSEIMIGTIFYYTVSSLKLKLLLLFLVWQNFNLVEQVGIVKFDVYFNTCIRTY